MKIYLESNGCTRRKSEISTFYNYFILNGYEVVAKPDEADHILISTCAFKKAEEDYSVSRIRTLMEYKADLLVYGCLPDIAPNKYREFSDVSHVAPKNIEEIDSHFENIDVKFSEVKDSNVISDHINYSSMPTAIKKFKNEFEFSSQFISRAMSYAEKRLRKIFSPDKKYFYLFICRGCLGNCSYCAIKRSIGTIKSKPIEKIMNEFREGVDSGYHDFIILGDDVGGYGRDTDTTVSELLSRLINEMQELSSNNGSRLKGAEDMGFHIEEIHPRWVLLQEEMFLDLIASKKIKSILCPIQSGSNRLLKSMNRYHTAEGISDFFRKARALYPDMKLSTHLLVGYPSETDEEFGKSLSFLGQVRFDDVTIFPYDEKENTQSAGVNPKVPEDVIQRRVQEAYKFLREQKIKAFLSCPS